MLAFGFFEGRGLELIGRSLRLGRSEFDFVIKDAFGVEKIDASGFFIKLKDVKLQNLLKNMDNSGVIFEFIFLDECDKHANHRISIETT
jgi:hypothetical protein